MSTIIAGSRRFRDRIFEDYSKVLEVISLSGFTITEVVSGMAEGVDSVGEKWADINNIPVKKSPAKWHDLDEPGAVINVNAYGKAYNFLAGHVRNEKMAQYALNGDNQLILIWNGKSTGSVNMLGLAKKYELKIYLFNLETDKGEHVAIQTSLF